MKIWIIGAIVILIIGAVFLFASKDSSLPTGSIIEGNSEVKEFNVKAFRFAYDPEVIKVEKGDRVRIRIDNTDILHGMRILDLNVNGNEVVEFTADKVGEFNWYCNNYCGTGHGSMQGKLIVTE